MISHANSTGKWAVQGMSRRKSIQQKKTAFAVFIGYHGFFFRSSSFCLFRAVHTGRNPRPCSRSAFAGCAGPYAGRHE